MAGRVGIFVPKTPRQKWVETKESWERSRHIEIPPHVPAAPPRPGGLRVAFLIYRGNPRCGGQGVYTRHLTRELVALGHSVEVFAGPPWPELDPGVGFTPVPGLDLYRDPDPFRVPHPPRVHQPRGLGGVRHHVHRRIRGAAGLLAAGAPLAGGAPGRLRRRPRQPVSRHRDARHGPRRVAAADDPAPSDNGRPPAGPLAHDNPWQRFTTNRWFGFLGMQVRVALPCLRSSPCRSRPAGTSRRRCRCAPSA